MDSSHLILMAQVLATLVTLVAIAQTSIIGARKSGCLVVVIPAPGTQAETVTPTASPELTLAVKMALAEATLAPVLEASVGTLLAVGPQS